MSSNYADKSYAEFFKEELYIGFVQFLLNKYTARQINDVLRDSTLFTKKGVHYTFRKDFAEFLSENPLIEKRFANEYGKTFVLRNIANENLRFPIDTEDEYLMIKEGIRVRKVEESWQKVHKPSIPRPTKEMKRKATMANQILRGNGHDDVKYKHPRELRVHYKRGYAMKIGRTTDTFKVDCKSDVNDILFNRFEGRIAYAMMGEQRFMFVKPSKKASKAWQEEYYERRRK